MTAHAVVTISWTVVALLLLAGGISNAVPRISGLVPRVPATPGSYRGNVRDRERCTLIRPTVRSLR